jgi:L-aminopeptidase/D-esterase-like protein
MKEIDLMSIKGFKIGHYSDFEAATGCTVIICDKMCPAGVDIRGGGPASRESQLLNPLMAAGEINGVLLSGGSAFGLDAAGGVLEYLSENGIGLDVGGIRVPLVPESCIFDLGVGRGDVRPDKAAGRKACENASYDSVVRGNVGAGTGASVGKCCGMERAMKSGVGTFAVEVGDLKVGAIVVVNAIGDIFEDGKAIAGLINEEGDGISSSFNQILKWQELRSKGNTLADIPNENSRANTTIGAIITNAKFDKSMLCKIAGMAHNGYGRAINPVHSMMDGDSIYALSVGDVNSDVNTVGMLAAYVMEKAIIDGVKQAKPAYGLKAYEDFNQ